MAGGLYYYFNIYSSVDDSENLASFYVVETIERGEVTSGIETTGDIVAAQKLDLDVYKQLSRIDVVNVANGSHVEEGDVLISFDKSDAYVDTQSARVAVTEAELSLQEEQVNATDPSTSIRSKENQITGYKKTISDAEQDIVDAYRDFLNEDLEAVADSDRVSVQDSRNVPALSGRYVNDEEGKYVIEIYHSGADSGFSYHVSGLETMTGPIIFNKASDLGTRGLKVTFTSDVVAGDTWVVYVPNIEIATYAETKSDYEQTVANLKKNISDAEVNLANAEQELKDLQLTDTSSYRDLDVEKAETSLAEAQQRLSQTYDSIEELDIIAPFSGFIDGMENVVVGATPTGGSEDSISLGTLISDEFLTTFSLGAADVAKVEVGQRVIVTVTSFSDEPTFEATITQISSLPESSGVAQYEIQALLDYDRTTAEVILREGMLADIEIVEEEKADALRLSTSAITYEQGTPKVTVVYEDDLTEDQKQQVERMGIIRTDANMLPTYDVEVELGIVGEYYVEIISGIDEGAMVVSTSMTESSETVVGQSGFGPGSGAGRDGGTPPEGGPQG